MYKQHDYNLLKVLVLIYQYRNLTTVAAVLGKTESAVSKHLAKLRTQLDDPLFVRSASGLEPTHYLERIIPGIENGLRLVEDALKQGESFNESLYDQPIVIGLDNVTIECFGGVLLQTLRSVFPNSFIELKTWRSNTYQEIIDGKVQIGLQFFNEDCSKSIYQNSILNVELGALVGANSDFEQWQQIFERPCVFFEIRGWNETNRRLIKQMAQYDLIFDYRVKLDNLDLALDLVKNEDYSILFAKHLINDGEVRFVPLPDHMQSHIPVVTCIKQRNRQSPLHQKLHQILKQVVTQESPRKI